MARRPLPDPFEELWRHREEDIYPSLFGKPRPGIHALTPTAYQRLGASAVDPRWLTYGIHRYGPGPLRRTTLHASHGLSLPWDRDVPDWDPEGPSGLGYEIVLETPRAWEWALGLAVDLLAYATLLASSRGPDEPAEPVLRHGARIPWGRPPDGRPRCRFRTVFLMKPPRLAAGFGTAAGRVRILQATCITDGEAAYARRLGPDALAVALTRADAVAFDPRRPEIPGLAA